MRKAKIHFIIGFSVVGGSDRVMYLSAMAHSEIDAVAIVRPAASALFDGAAIDIVSSEVAK